MKIVKLKTIEQMKKEYGSQWRHIHFSTWLPEMDGYSGNIVKLIRRPFDYLLQVGDSEKYFTIDDSMIYQDFSDDEMAKLLFGELENA